jgi:hypothetical protein
MKTKVAFVAAGALLASLVTACGDDNGGMSTTSTPAPASSNLALNTEGVLALARESSETTSPLPVNAGALTLTDTSDTTAPVNLNAM